MNWGPFVGCPCFEKPASWSPYLGPDFGDSLNLWDPFIGPNPKSQVFGVNPAPSQEDWCRFLELCGCRRRLRKSGIPTTDNMVADLDNGQGP